ncbi:MAG: nuclear transport factor 2 family protein [Deltaproteobacteria bacterium]|nr:MAG: nuclear transport factor 2 family protein [Deltaproteobacteria bacterium]
MKKLILLGLAVITLTACKQEQRYFAESDEINTLKAGIAAFESADWEKWQSHFADTAKIYVNSTDSMSLADRVAGLKEMTNAMSSYGFDHEDDYIEMVLDKEHETWVYYWATYNGTVAGSGKELSMPVHLAVQFANGKIVEEHVYFDATEMNAEFAAVAAAAAKMEEESTEADAEESDE